ncbi:McrC family protein [Agrococcus sp. TF02-05]|uniref:McrC family protein n=1 Tax=Agrococcus sp. TF02-05 TaxID=2815211 RepID=UPI001AA1474A|nr:hypothetical protein [Agrococcus sp. TF02-05]MBO1769291.1 hypothetical protein [Agrococcus sp. TF02-05]
MRVSELGTTSVRLAPTEAALLQSLDVCALTPTLESGVWHISDVRRVGIVDLGGQIVEFIPKVPIRSLVYMASAGHAQLALAGTHIAVDSDVAIPSAFAAALLEAVAHATRGGLVKGYRGTEESSTVLRGRWDVVHQIRRRPGRLLPAEIRFDDFTEDVLENRILAAALRVAARFAGLPPALQRRLRAALVDFASVTALSPRAALADNVVPDRRTAHYESALRIAEWILRSASWTRSAGRRAGGAFVVEPAALFESFIGHRLRDHLQPTEISVQLQASRWRLDDEGRVRMRPDIVLKREGRVVGVADTKYKRHGDTSASPPNADIYQALAYATAAGLEAAHLIYVAREVETVELRIGVARKRVIVHAVDVSGAPAALDAEVRRLALALHSSSVSAGPSASPVAAAR